MSVRGRASAADEQTQVVEVRERPVAPEDLNPVAVNEWNRVINSVSADWFEDHHLTTLAAYCGHVSDLSEINALLEMWKGAEGRDVQEYDRLLKMRERETRAINAHLRSMRLTHQATYSAMKKPPSQPGEKLWQ